MPKVQKLSTTKKLKGQELLDRLKDLEGLSKTRKAEACGYVSEDKNGKERTRITEFMNALLEAEGIQLDSQSDGHRGRSLSYRVSVQQNGNIIIGSGYTREMNLDPGDRFDITLGRKKIKLTAIDAEHSDAHEFEEFADDDEEFDDDEID